MFQACASADLLRGGPHVRVGQRQVGYERDPTAYRMAEDPGLPLTNVQFDLGHRASTTTQRYLTPREQDVVRRVLAHNAE
jgi:hypothetical protein